MGLWYSMHTWTEWELMMIWWNIWRKRCDTQVSDCLMARLWLIGCDNQTKVNIEEKQPESDKSIEVGTKRWRLRSISQLPITGLHFYLVSTLLTHWLLTKTNRKRYEFSNPQVQIQLQEQIQLWNKMFREEEKKLFDKRGAKTSTIQIYSTIFQRRLGHIISWYRSSSAYFCFLNFYIWYWKSLVPILSNTLPINTTIYIAISWLNRYHHHYHHLSIRARDSRLCSD